MTEFEDLLALGWEAEFAEEAVVAAQEHGPGDAGAERDRVAVVIGHLISFDQVGDHFVTEDARGGFRTAAKDGVQVAPTDGCATDANQGFALSQGRQLKVFERERLMRGVKYRCGGMRTHEFTVSQREMKLR